MEREVWARVAEVLGEAPNRVTVHDGGGILSYEGPEGAGINYILYYKELGYLVFEYKMLTTSDSMEEIIEQIVQEFSAVFAELSTMPDIDYLVDELVVRVMIPAIQDSKRVWRESMNISTTAGTIRNADWKNPTFELVNALIHYRKFSDWWSDNNEGNYLVLPVTVTEDDGSAKFIVGIE
ncbi:MAG: hypothetical protein KGZ63_00205 [Clostridiales bacterium]|jgi:hypothetical protein|nr:hypothetical protein [Clostridiales bacterium]